MFLRREQGVLIEQLKRRSPEIADMYYGGLCSFADEKNPFRLPLAAHAFREVIAHCARSTGESVVFGESMGSRINPVREAFQAWKQTSAIAVDSTATIVGMSDELRDALEAFFDWQEHNRPEARKKTALMLTQLAGPAPALPSDVVAGEISAWMRVDQYFKLVAHSKHKTKPEEFLNNLFLVEDILLRRLQPRPVSDLDEIDALLAEADDAQ
jgi:hypothetical protein